MTWLAISIIINVVLFLAIILYVAIYDRNIKEAKLSTFFTVLGALSYGVAVTDNDERYRRLAFSFGQILRNTPVELIEGLLRRSAMFGYLSSKDPSLIDLLPERDRLAAARFATKHGIDSAKVDEMWQYIERALTLQDGYVEPVKKYGGEEFKKGQIFSEMQLVSLYDLALKKAA